jgi:hypothetical protein
MKKRITGVIMTIRADMFLKIWRELEHRLDVVPATKVPHIELYYDKFKTLRV